VKRKVAKGIYKRGNVFWIRYVGLDGRMVYESSGSDKFRDAEDKYNRRKNTIKDGKQPEIKKIGNHTFNELAEKYLSWMEGGQKSAKMTLRYSHLAPSHKVKAVDILDNILNGKISLVGERFLHTNYTKTIQSGELRNVQSL